MKTLTCYQIQMICSEARQQKWLASSWTLLCRQKKPVFDQLTKTTASKHIHSQKRKRQISIVWEVEANNASYETQTSEFSQLIVVNIYQLMQLQINVLTRAASIFFFALLLCKMISQQFSLSQHYMWPSQYIEDNNVRFTEMYKLVDLCKY